MAKPSGGGAGFKPDSSKRKKKRTSIGRSKNSRPKNRKANRKRYKGQGL